MCKKLFGLVGNHIKDIYRYLLKSEVILEEGGLLGNLAIIANKV